MRRHRSFISYFRMYCFLYVFVDFFQKWIYLIMLEEKVSYTIFGYKIFVVVIVPTKITMWQVKLSSTQELY